MNFNN